DGPTAAGVSPGHTAAAARLARLLLADHETSALGEANSIACDPSGRPVVTFSFEQCHFAAIIGYGPPSAGPSQHGPGTVSDAAGTPPEPPTGTQGSRRRRPSP